MGHTNMGSCHWCGAPEAEGYAFIGDLRYCHGDWQDVTCYMQAQHQEQINIDGWLDDGGV